LLVVLGGEFLTDDTRKDIGARTGRGGDDDANGPVGEWCAVGCVKANAKKAAQYKKRDMKGLNGQSRNGGMGGRLSVKGINEK